MKSPKTGPVTAMKAALDKTHAETKSLKNEYLRSLAEFDNYRRRREKECSDFREAANENLLKALLPILDNLDRALEASQSAAAAGCCDEGLRKGIRVTTQQLLDTLAKFGLAAYSCVGESFDPRKCEAVNFVETDDKPEGMVVAETAKGYVYGTRVLRPAIVVVAKARPKPEPEKEEPKEADAETAADAPSV